MLWEANSQGILVGIRSAHRSANGCVVCDDAVGPIGCACLWGHCMWTERRVTDTKAEFQTLALLGGLGPGCAAEWASVSSSKVQVQRDEAPSTESILICYPLPAPCARASSKMGIVKVASPGSCRPHTQNLFNVAHEMEEQFFISFHQIALQ